MTCISVWSSSSRSSAMSIPLPVHPMPAPPSGPEPVLPGLRVA